MCLFTWYKFEVCLLGNPLTQHLYTWLCFHTVFTAMHLDECGSGFPLYWGLYQYWLRLTHQTCISKLKIIATYETLYNRLLHQPCLIWYQSICCETGLSKELYHSHISCSAVLIDTMCHCCSQSFYTREKLFSTQLMYCYHNKRSWCQTQTLTHCIHCFLLCWTTSTGC